MYTHKRETDGARNRVGRATPLAAKITPLTQLLNHPLVSNLLTQIFLLSQLNKESNLSLTPIFNDPLI